MASHEDGPEGKERGGHCPPKPKQRLGGQRKQYEKHPQPHEKDLHVTHRPMSPQDTEALEVGHISSEEHPQEKINFTTMLSSNSPTTESAMKKWEATIHVCSL